MAPSHLNNFKMAFTSNIVNAINNITATIPFKNKGNRMFHIINPKRVNVITNHHIWNLLSLCAVIMLHINYIILFSFMQVFYFPCFFLFISYKITPVATAAFRLSVFPGIGIFILSFAKFKTFSETPFASFPITTADFS